MTQAKPKFLFAMLPFPGTQSCFEIQDPPDFRNDWIDPSCFTSRPGSSSTVNGARRPIDTASNTLGHVLSMLLTLILTYVSLTQSLTQVRIRRSPYATLHSPR